MLNLSQIVRESPNYTLIQKVKNFRAPDVCIAENLADYQKNAPNLGFPWYKRSPLSSMFGDKAYIIFRDIGLKKLLLEKVEVPNWFVLHDYSGQELVYWDANNVLFPTCESFDEVHEKQGLKEDDWVYEVIVRYSQHSTQKKLSLSSIIKVNKYNSSNKNPKETSLIEKIRSFFPEFKPKLQTA